MTLPVEVRLLARDRRLAAVHEAGHYVIAEWAGMRRHGAFIQRVHTDDLATEHAWLGRYCADAKRIARLSCLRRTMISFAGGAAERVWKAQGQLEQVWYDDLLDDDSQISATDWEMTGANPGDPGRKLDRALDFVIELLAGPLWPPLLSSARTLITGGELVPTRLSRSETQKIKNQLRFSKSVICTS